MQAGFLKRQQHRTHEKILGTRQINKGSGAAPGAWGSIPDGVLSAPDVASLLHVANLLRTSSYATGIPLSNSSAPGRKHSDEPPTSRFTNGVLASGSSRIPKIPKP